FDGEQDFGGRDYALRWEGIFGTSWVVSAQAARHKEENSVGPASAAGDIIEFRCADVIEPGPCPSGNFFQTGGFGLVQKKDFRRDFGGASASLYLGNHQIRFGAEYEKEKAEVTKRMSGGQQVDIFPNPVNPSMPIYRH